MSSPSNKTLILLLILLVLLGGSSCSSQSTNFQPQEGQQSWWEKQQEGQQAWWDWVQCQFNGNCNESSSNPTYSPTRASPTDSPTVMISMSPSYSPTTTTTTSKTAEEVWSHSNDPNTSSSLLLMVLLPVLGIAWGIDVSAMHQTIHSYLQPPYYFYKHTSSKCALILYGIGIVTLDALLFFLFGYSVLRLNHNNNNNNSSSVWMCVGMVVLLFGRFCTRIHWVANHLVLEKLAKWLQWKEEQDVLALRSQEDDDSDTVAVTQEDESGGGGGWIPTILYHYPHHHDNDNDDHNHDNSKSQKWYNRTKDKLKRIHTEMKLKAERVQNSTKQLYDVGLQEAMQETNDSHNNNNNNDNDGMIELKHRASSSSGDYNVATFTIADNDDEVEEGTGSNSIASSHDKTRQGEESESGSSSSLLSRVLQWQGDVTFHIV